MTPKERAAMQQALEALEKARGMIGYPANMVLYGEELTLREALAEQAEQEIIPSWEEYCECEGIPCEPVKPVDLTDDEIYEVCKDVPFIVIGPDYDLAIARAVIAAYKEKNK